METLPWYQSKVLQAQIVQFIVAALTMVGVTTDVDWDAATAGIFAGIAGLMAIWAAASRLFKANPPITETAVLAEKKFQSTPKK